LLFARETEKSNGVCGYTAKQTSIRGFIDRHRDEMAAPRIEARIEVKIGAAS
jgi:hypothetical protein